MPIAPAQHTIRYIANEGIFIQLDDHNILIDAIFDDHYKIYRAPTEQTIRHINAKEHPYQKVDLLLITHSHLDHFTSEMVTEFLELHAETEMICPQQVVHILASNERSFTRLEPRITNVRAKKEWQSLFLKGVGIQTAYVRHGGETNYAIDNQIYLIKANGKKILHLGDAEMAPFHFLNLHLAQPPVDVALIPYWFLAYPPGIDIIKNQIRPNKLIAIHYPKVGDPKVLRKIRENFPNAVVFMEGGDQIEF